MGVASSMLINQYHTLRFGTANLGGDGYGDLAQGQRAIGVE